MTTSGRQLVSASAAQAGITTDRIVAEDPPEQK
jgi:hypothetical protein